MIINKIHLIFYSILIITIIVLGVFVHFYKVDIKEKDKKILALELDVNNTKINLQKANDNIDKANKNLDNYIKLNNQLNKQLKDLNNTNIEDINIEMKQINCLFENMAKRGDCINGQFIEN